MLGRTAERLAPFTASAVSLPSFTRFTAFAIGKQRVGAKAGAVKAEPLAEAA